MKPCPDAPPGIDQVFGGLLRANRRRPVRRSRPSNRLTRAARRRKRRGEEVVLFPARESLPYFLFAFLATFLAGFFLATLLEVFFALFFFTATVAPLVS